MDPSSSWRQTNVKANSESDQKSERKEIDEDLHYATKWDEQASWQSLSDTLWQLIEKAVHEIQSRHNERDWNYLDVGSGPGNITNVISEYFHHFMTIEPNPCYHRDYADKTFKEAQDRFCGNIGDIVQNIEIDAVEFEDMTFDLITCIHCWYYIEIKDYEVTLNKLYEWLSDDGGTLIIAVAPKFKDRSSDWSQILRHFSGEFFDSLQCILSICKSFDECKIEIYDEEMSFDNEYESVDDAVDTMLWNLIQELSFCGKYSNGKESEVIAAKMLRSYLTNHCVDSKTGKCTVTASVGHIVITKCKHKTAEVQE